MKNKFKHTENFVVGVGDYYIALLVDENGDTIDGINPVTFQIVDEPWNDELGKLIFDIREKILVGGVQIWDGEKIKCFFSLENHKPVFYEDCYLRFPIPNIKVF